MNTAEILSECSLTKDEALDAIESVVARVLTHALHANVIVRIEDQLQIFLPVAEPRQFFLLTPLTESCGGMYSTRLIWNCNCGKP